MKGASKVCCQCSTPMLNSYIHACAHAVGVGNHHHWRLQSWRWLAKPFWYLIVSDLCVPTFLNPTRLRKPYTFVGFCNSSMSSIHRWKQLQYGLSVELRQCSMSRAHYRSVTLSLSILRHSSQAVVDEAWQASSADLFLLSCWHAAVQHTTHQAAMSHNTLALTHLACSQLTLDCTAHPLTSGVQWWPSNLQYKRCLYRLYTVISIGTQKELGHIELGNLFKLVC